MNKKNISQKEKDIQSLMNLAARQGIELIYQKHPVFYGTEKLLMEHIDFKRLRKKSEEIYNGLLENNIHGEKARDYIGRELTDYIQSAEFFDKKGNEIIAKGSLKEKPSLLEKITSFLVPKSEGEKELNNIMETLYNLSLLYQSKNYKNSLPELNEHFKEADKYLQRLSSKGFVPAAASIFEAYGQIDKKQANLWRKEYTRSHKEDVKEGRENIERIKAGIEKYIVPEKIVASIFLFFGIAMSLSNMEITGAVIGSLKHSIKGVIGVSLMTISAILFLLVSKKKL